MARSAQPPFFAPSGARAHPDPARPVHQCQVSSEALQGVSFLEYPQARLHAHQELAQAIHDTQTDQHCFCLCEELLDSQCTLSLPLQRTDTAWHQDTKVV